MTENRKVFTMDMILSDFKQQTLNDAINFLDKAKNTDQNKTPLEFWSYCSWAIISATTCMESFLTGHILAEINEFDIPNRQIRGRNFGFDKKIKYIKNNLGITLEDSSQEWENVLQTVYYRNDIIHFNKSAITSLFTIDNAEKAILACKTVIRRCKQGFNAMYPPWVESFIK